MREARGMREPSRSVYEWALELLAKTGTSLDQLDCIAFGAGPGSFTGVRVAVALAQALGYSRDLPLCPVSSLAALASGVLEQVPGDLVAACLDARMGEVYLGIYRRDEAQGVMTVATDALLAPGAVSVPGDSPFHAVGPGWASYPDVADRLRARLITLKPDCLPSAADIVRLARPMFLAGRTVLPAQVVPNYLRDQVASVK